VPVAASIRQPISPTSARSARRTMKNGPTSPGEAPWEAIVMRSSENGDG
jgi:hypothetical protein